jgi:hypothetical protein
MSLFTPTRPDAFNRDDVVVHHEVAHTVVWFSYGGEIKHIRFERIGPSSSVAGRLRGGSGNRNPNDLSQTKDAEMFAERMLAGESAARRHIGANRRFISTMPVGLTKSTNVPALVRVGDRRHDVLKHVISAYNRDASNWFSALDGIFNGAIPEIPLLITSQTSVPDLLQIGREEDDAIWAINAGYEAVGKDWYPWVKDRLAKVRRIVDKHWTAIEGISKELIPELPQETGELLKEKDALESLLTRHGVTTPPTNAL